MPVVTGPCDTLIDPDMDALRPMLYSRTVLCLSGHAVEL